MASIKASFFTKSTNSLRQKIQEFFRFSSQWFLHTPERALLEAYSAAETINNIEQQYFGGKNISPKSVNDSENVMSYWQVELDRSLTIIKVRLAELRLSRAFLNTSDPAFLEKLKFIDEVIAKYNLKVEEINSSALIPVSQPLPININEVNKQPDSSNKSNKNITQVQPASKRMSILPRTIGRTLNKIKADLSPDAEEKFVREYQVSRTKTRTAVKFLAMLIIVPLLTQQVSKQFLVSPIVDRVRGENSVDIFLNSEMEEEAYHELNIFEKELKFESVIIESPSLSLETIEKKVKEKAIEIAEEFRKKSSDAVSNAFADLISLVAFALVVVTSKKEIVIVQSFIDEIVYGLSDSAKAFLIILFTDIFVGFHSPHGWEVILEGMAEHLGLPANQSAISLFIATFPVVLDTVFKYWIFRYLSRLSPSALATLKEMNE
jgi:CemA family